MNHKILRFLRVALMVIAFWLSALAIVLGSPVLVKAVVVLFVVFLLSFTVEASE